MATWSVSLFAALLVFAPVKSFALDETLTTDRGANFFKAEPDDTGWAGPVRSVTVGNGRTTIRFQQGVDQPFCFFDTSIPGFHITNPTCRQDLFSVELGETAVSQRLGETLQAYAADGHFIKLAFKWWMGHYSLDPLPQNFGPASMILNDITRLNRIEDIASVDLAPMGQPFSDIRGFIVDRGAAKSITGFYRRPGVCGAVTVYTKGSAPDLALERIQFDMQHVTNIGKILLVSVAFENCNHRKFKIEILGDKGFEMTVDQYKENRRLTELGNVVLSDMSSRMHYVSLLTEFDRLIQP